MDVRSRSTGSAARVSILCGLGFALIASLPLSASAEQDAKAEAEALYAFGVSLAQNLETGLGMTADEAKKLQSGMNDYFAGKAKPGTEDAAKIQAFQRARVEAALDREKGASAAYLTEQAKAKGATQLDGGIVYFDLAAGSGDSPVLTDKVRVTYKGTLRDGTVFDSNLDRESPTVFPLNGVIPCWQQAIGRMKPGGKAKFICPSGLAYGDRGRPGIPPGAALQFEVELIGIGEE